MITKEIRDAEDKFFLDFPYSPVFDQARYNLMMHLLGTTPGQAFFILHNLHRSINISGDVAEFGVAQGATSALLAHEIINCDKRLHLFDSFKGLPKPTENDVLLDDFFELGSMDKYEGTMVESIEGVKDRL